MLSAGSGMNLEVGHGSDDSKFCEIVQIILENLSYFDGVTDLICYDYGALICNSVFPVPQALYVISAATISTSNKNQMRCASSSPNLFLPATYLAVRCIAA